MGQILAVTPLNRSLIAHRAVTPYSDSSTTPAIDWKAKEQHSLTPSADITPTFVNPQVGYSVRIAYSQPVAGGKGITWPAGITWPGGDTGQPDPAASASTQYKIECWGVGSYRGFKTTDVDLARSADVAFIIDGGDAAITTGIKGDLEIPFACTIISARLFADQIGSIVIDIWKDNYTNFPPTGADSITASAKPTLSSAQKSQDTTLTGWTTALTAGDILRFNVDSVNTVRRVTLSLYVTKT